MKPPNRVVIMGVTGSGKTTVGRLLAEEFDGSFVDGDDLHPQGNIDKMSRGSALTDADRRPWLDEIAKVIRDHKEVTPLVVACSALKKNYRRRLGDGFHLIYLKGTPALIAGRLADRRDHFMPGSLLESQFQVLEEPEDAIVMDLDHTPREIVEKIIVELS